MTDADRPHLLLVDDEAITVMALERFLGRKGFRVSVAANGQEALTLAAQDPPDLVVTDMRMPRLSGKDLIRRLRDDRPGLPVVVVTGYMAADMETSGLDGPETVVLTKPLDPEALIVTMNGLLGRTS